jgi:excisionase family DNA binding protein
MTEELLTVAEAAEYVNLTERWLRRAIFEGRIETVKLGRLVRIPRRALDELIEEGRRPRAASGA